VLKPGGSAVLQVAHYHLKDALNAMAKHLDYVWLLVEEYAYGGARHWKRRIVIKYKPHLWFSKGVRQGDWIFDRFDGSRRDKRYHDWGDSLAFSMWVIERLTRPGALVLDPCLGSGTTAVACLQTGRNCIGFEINPVTAEAARWRIALQPPLFVPEAERLPEQLQLTAWRQFQDV
jgi:hypothetical protein